MVEFSKKEIEDFYKIIYKGTGIDLNLYKSQQLLRRLSMNLKKIGYNSLKDLGNAVLSNADEKEKFINFLTINVTNFFRDKQLFEELKEVLKSEIIPNNEKIKIWSAGCSMGCEAYSVAMMLNELGIRGNRYLIKGSDLDKDIIVKAKEGIYGESDIREMDRLYVKKYFAFKDGKYKLSPTIMNSVKFENLNLLEDDFESNYDLILCRNVVIYFTEEAQRDLFSKFAKSLKNGGFIFIGATESIFNYKEFGLEKISMYIYKKIKG